jgi:hypothetical protein
MLILFCGHLHPDRSNANGMDEGENFLISVFDCYMPIPIDFVLQTGDSSRITLSLRSKTDVARIVVSDYQETLDESFVKTGSREVAGLAVESFSVKSQFRKGADAVRLHDGKQQMFIYGHVDGIIESLLRGCRELKRGTLYEK